jgi:hypothetical protein
MTAANWIVFAAFKGEVRPISKNQRKIREILS